MAFCSGDDTDQYIDRILPILKRQTYGTKSMTFNGSERAIVLIGAYSSWTMSVLSRKMIGSQLPVAVHQNQIWRNYSN